MSKQRQAWIEWEAPDKRDKEHAEKNAFPRTIVSLYFALDINPTIRGGPPTWRSLTIFKFTFVGCLKCVSQHNSVEHANSA